MSEPTQAESSTVTLEIPAAGTPEYKHYKLTGELPQKSSEPKSVERESAADGEGESASASEAGNETQEHARPQRRRGNAETRIQELLAENKRLKAEREQRSSETRSETKPAESSTAKTESAQPAKLEPPKKPDIKDFTVAKYGSAEKAYEAYDAAKDEYFEKLTEYKSELAVQRDRQQRFIESEQAKLDKELAEGEKRYGEKAMSEKLKPVAAEIFSDKQIPIAVKEIFNQSPVLVDLLYVFASDDAQFKAWQKLARTNPAKAIREAVILEQLVAEELSGKKSSTESSSAQTEEESDSEVEQQDEDEESLESGEAELEEEDEEEAGEVERDGKTGRFKKAPARKITQAPGPTREVKGTTTAAADEAQAALERGDFKRYREIKNAQDLKRRGQKA